MTNTFSLDEDLSKVATPLYIPERAACEPHLFCSMERFVKYVSKFYCFDCITYSQSIFSGLVPNRLIYGLRTGLPKNKNWKYVPSIHTKLFLLYNKTKLHRAYVGSFNLCAPTTENLMIEAGSQKVRNYLKEYFEYIWKRK